MYTGRLVDSIKVDEVSQTIFAQTIEQLLHYDISTIGDMLLQPPAMKNFHSQHWIETLSKEQPRCGARLYRNTSN